ncbi:hypothetical protein MMPV_006632 [Pyropia vietnamensis]
MTVYVEAPCAGSSGGGGGSGGDGGGGGRVTWIHPAASRANSGAWDGVASDDGVRSWVGGGGGARDNLLLPRGGGAGDSSDGWGRDGPVARLVLSPRARARLVAATISRGGVSVTTATGTPPRENAVDVVTTDDPPLGGGIKRRPRRPEEDPRGAGAARGDAAVGGGSCDGAADAEEGGDAADGDDSGGDGGDGDGADARAVGVPEGGKHGDDDPSVTAAAKGEHTKAGALGGEDDRGSSEVCSGSDGGSACAGGGSPLVGEVGGSTCGGPSTTPLTQSDGATATEMQWVSLDAPMAAEPPALSIAATAGGVPGMSAVSGALPDAPPSAPVVGPMAGATFLTNLRAGAGGTVGGGSSGTPTEGHSLLPVDTPTPLTPPGGGRVVIKFGGRDAAGGWRASVHAFAVTTGKWSAVTPAGLAPTGRTGHAAAVLAGGRMVVFGGATRAGRVSDLHVLDTGRMAWTPLGRSGGTAAVMAATAATAASATTATIGGEIVGRRGRWMGTAAASATSLMATWHGGRAGGSTTAAASGGPASDVATPAARARTTFVATESGTAAVLYGGRSGYTYMGDRYFADLHLWDGGRGGWLRLHPRRGSPAPGPRASHVSHLVNDRAVLVHGGLLDGACTYADTWLFDLAAGTWVRPPYADGPGAPMARESHASAALPGSIVVFGGAADTGMYLNDVGVFDTGTLRWAEGGVVARGATPVGRTAAALVPLDDRRLLLVGGETGWSTEGGRGTLLDTASASVAEMRELLAAAVDRGGGAEACVVCLTAPVDTVFLWCAHYVCCWGCAKRVMPVCPLCREHVFKAQRVFKR